MAVNSSLSLLPATLSPKLSKSSSIPTSTHFQPKTRIPLFRHFQMTNGFVLTPVSFIVHQSTTVMCLHVGHLQQPLQQLWNSKIGEPHQKNSLQQPLQPQSSKLQPLSLSSGLNMDKPCSHIQAKTASSDSEEVSSMEWEFIKMSEDEEDLIYRMYRLVGDRWHLIAGRIPGRRPEEVERFWIMRHSETFAKKRKEHAYLGETYSSLPSVYFRSKSEGYANMV